MLSATLLALFTVMTACSPVEPPIPTATNVPPARLPTATLNPTTPSPLLPTSPACLTQPGRIDEGTLDSFKPAQEFRVYLPPCYDEEPDERYPVLYLLHGQTYTDDQWVRLGAARVLDELIHSGDVQPFMIVLPDDRYWNLQAGPGFGDRLVNAIIPHIDSTYRTLPDRDHRAIGGLSRGAGWSLRLGLSQWELFGAVGLHSLAASQNDTAHIGDWLGTIPISSRPAIFMDIGDNDPELAMAQLVESQFNDAGLPHEWHLYSGAHTEDYWSAHVEEYLRWYAEQWNNR